MRKRGLALTAARSFRRTSMVIKNFAVTNAPPRSAAIDNNDQNFFIGHAGFEAVNEFATGHFRERLRDFRHDAAGNVDDFISFAVGNKG